MMQKLNKNQNNNGELNIDLSDWKNLSLAQILEITKTNKWNDANKHVMKLITSLTIYNFLEMNNQNDEQKENDREMKVSESENEEEEEEEKKMTGSEALKIVSDLKKECQCNVCLDFYIEPVTLSCGHSFCRSCVASSLSKCKKQCPLCKTVCNINPHLHPQNIVINNFVKATFSSKRYNQRMIQLNEQKEKLKKQLPVFMLNTVQYPGMSIQLLLFEPKYLHMIKRVLSSGNTFAYLCQSMNNNGNEYHPYNNDIAVSVKIEECEFLPDGRALIQGRVEKRIIVQSNWIERGTQGLWYITYSDYKDENKNDVDNDNNKMNPEHVALINKFVAQIYKGSNHVIQAIEKECGHRVFLGTTNMEQWSFWIVSLIYKLMGKNGISLSWIKHQLHTKNTLARVQLCYYILQSQSSRWNQ